MEEGSVQEVIFLDGAFRGKDIFSDEKYTDFAEEFTSFEVIGNIYENPELLESK